MDGVKPSVATYALIKTKYKGFSEANHFIFVPKITKRKPNGVMLHPFVPCLAAMDNDHRSAIGELVDNEVAKSCFYEVCYICNDSRSSHKASRH